MTFSSEGLDGASIVSQIFLASDEEVGDFRVGAEVDDLGDPFFLHVVQRVGLVDREAD